MSTELAIRAFEADAAFSLSLAELQEQVASQPAVPQALALANQHGFSWLFRPAGDGLVEAVLRHSAGSEEKAIGEEPLPLVLGLLGVSALVSRAQPAEPEAMQKMHSSAPAAVDEAAQALATATDGAVVDEPETALERSQDDSLSEDEKAAAVAMVKVMDAAQRKAFTIAFRHAFEVPSSERAIQPLITELRHLQFIDRFTIEAAGGVAP